MASQKKKKQPKNAFYFFFIEYKKEQEDRGVRFLGGLKEVTQKAAPLWQALSARERWIYEEEARKEKERDKVNLENKFTTQGKSYAEIEREKRDEIEEQNRMMQEIEGTVRSLDYSTTLTTQNFHVIHVNYYCKKVSGLYTPCELAIAEFNFMEGVKNMYHTLINPGDIPLGYKFEADKYSADTHQIPVPPDDNGGETNYRKILQNIKHFLVGSKERNPEMPPLYTQPSLIEPVKNILKNLQEEDADDIFRVYLLPKLFYELRNACVTFPGAPAFPAYSLAERELDRDIFNFTRGISCEFHEDTDALPFCSLSCVRRWSFLIMDHCCKDLGIDLVPGVHCPSQADTARMDKMSSRASSVAGDLHRSHSSSIGSHTTFKPSIVDHGRLPPDPRTAEHFTLGATPGIVTRVKAEPKKTVLEPLRLPKTKSEALSHLEFPNFSDQDFPSIGSSSAHEPRGVMNQGPIAVPGRGRGYSQLESPLSLGRGRPLNTNLENELNKIQL